MISSIRIGVPRLPGACHGRLTADRGGPIGRHIHGHHGARGLLPDLRGYAPPEQPPQASAATRAHDNEVALLLTRDPQDGVRNVPFFQAVLDPHVRVTGLYQPQPTLPRPSI